MEKQPIRILHVIGKMDFGGAEALIMNIYRNIDRCRVQFDFVENTTEEAAFDKEILSLGGRVFNCPHYNGKNHFQYTKWWKRFFDEHAGEFCAVHGHLGSTAAIYLQIAKKHGLYTIAHSHNTKGVGFRDRLYRTYSFPTRFIADQFFACSRAAGIDRYGRKIGADENRCIVLHNAIDTKRFAYDPQKRDMCRSVLGIADGDLVIGHIGRFVPQKNHPFLVDVFAEIQRREPKSKLLLIGAEDREQTVRKKVDELGISDNVIFTGPQNDTAPYYQAMDLFLLPSLFEGLPLVMVEAQTSGLPCVISDKVPDECILAEDLVTICSLSSGAAEWADDVLSRIHDQRSDHSAVVAAKGFDAGETARQLADFYCARERTK